MRETSLRHLGYVLGVIVTGGVAFGLAASAGSRPTQEAAYVNFPQRAEAEALLDQTVQLARGRGFAELCQTVAASRGTCRELLQAADDAGWSPGSDAPLIVGARKEHRGDGVPTLILHVEGNRRDGSSYRSDFAVIKGDSGETRSLTPIYWSGVEYGENNG